MASGRKSRTVDVPGWPRARINYFEVDGGLAGPTVTIAAGTGGTAYPGIEACWRLMRSLEGTSFNGRIVVIPVLDVPGFMDRSAHFCTLNDRALEAAFESIVLKGAPHSTEATHAMASTVRDILGKPDFHVDLQGGEIHEEQAFWAAALPDDGGVPALAARAVEACGATFRAVISKSVRAPIPLGCAGMMARAGIPTLVISTGGVNFELERDAKLLEHSTLCVLMELGVLDWGSSTRPTPPRAVGPKSWTHLAAKTGLWLPVASAGARVKKGEPIGQICDYFGTVLESVTAPLDGWVLRILTSMAVDVNPRADGDPWFMRTVTLAEDRGPAGKA